MMKRVFIFILVLLGRFEETLCGDLFVFKVHKFLESKDKHVRWLGRGEEISKESIICCIMPKTCRLGCAGVPCQKSCGKFTKVAVLDIMFLQVGGYNVLDKFKNYRDDNIPIQSSVNRPSQNLTVPSFPMLATGNLFPLLLQTL